MRADPLLYADTARRLQGAARELGLDAPAFKAPSRNGNRTITRYPGSTVVAVRLRDREMCDVAVDMIDGILEANDRAGDETARTALIAALGQ